MKIPSSAYHFQENPCAKPLTKGVLQVWVRVGLTRKIQRKENKVTRHKFQISSSAKHSSALDLGSATLSNRQIVSRAVRLFGSNLPTKQLKNLRKQQLCLITRKSLSLSRYWQLMCSITKYNSFQSKSQHPAFLSHNTCPVGMGNSVVPPRNG